MFLIIFTCESWELNRGIFICLPQVIVFLNQDKFNQLPTDSQPSFITFFFIKWIAPEGVLHLPRSENVLLHVLNRRSSLAAPPSLSPSLWHNSSRACFNVSHDEDDKSVVAGERRLKNGLNYPLCWGYVCSRCVVFIAPMFTFISTCLKCVTILFSPPAAPPTPRSCRPPALDIRPALFCKQMLSSKENVLSAFH